MGYQFRLANLNEDDSPTRDRDSRALRYLLASNSSSSVALNNRTGSIGTNDQVLPDNQTSPSSESSPPRLFGSYLTLVPTNRRNNNDGASAIVTSTGTGNASLKRSRSPDFMRGESSNQGSQEGGTLRRRTNPPPPSFQQESVNNNNMPSITSTGPAGFFDDTPSYNSPTQSSIHEDIARFLFPYQQETHQASFSMPRRTELVYASTFVTSLYPLAMTRGITQAAVSTSYFQRNNNFLSYGASPSSSFPSLGWGFNGFNNNNLDLFNSIHQRIDDTFVYNTINIQQYVRVLPGGRVSLAPSIVPVRSNNHILTSTSPELRAQRNRLRDEVLRFIQHLRTAGFMSIEDLLILDYSIVLNVFDSQELMNMLHNIDVWSYEVISALEEDVERVETGLTEEEILSYIETETHVSDPNETNTQNKTCTICQEDYVEGEIIGRLDCRHIYHLECIKQWLLLKNACPICKQRALEVDEDEDESD